MLFPLPVHPSYHIMLEDLATVGLHESVMRMINASRFENLVNVEEPVFHELFVEFLSSFIFRGSTLVDYNRKNEVLFQFKSFISLCTSLQYIVDFIQIYLLILVLLIVVLII